MKSDTLVSILVYKDDLISTIVDFYFRRSFFVPHSRLIRYKFGKIVIKDLMAETLVSGFSLPPWINSVKKLWYLSVKNKKLSERSEFFLFSEKIIIS